MKDILFTILGLVTFALIVLVSVRGFSKLKRKFGLPAAILISVILFALAIAISLLTTIY